MKKTNVLTKTLTFFLVDRRIHQCFFESRGLPLYDFFLLVASTAPRRESSSIGLLALLFWRQHLERGVRERPDRVWRDCRAAGAQEEGRDGRALVVEANRVCAYVGPRSFAGVVLPDLSLGCALHKSPLVPLHLLSKLLVDPALVF